MDKANIKEGDHVVTTKGNHGKVVLVGSTTAKVKIGANTHEIELHMLTKINDGTTFHVEYLDDKLKQQKATVFVKHGTVIYNGITNPLLEVINKQLALRIKTKFTITTILIP